MKNMLAVCMGPLKKHCSESRTISLQIHNVKIVANLPAVCQGFNIAPLLCLRSVGNLGSILPISFSNVS